MSKESIKIIDANQMGQSDKRLKKPYKNPFCKNRQKDKHRAYRMGYNMFA